jgi:hypothetical protein
MLNLQIPFRLSKDRSKIKKESLLINKDLYLQDSAWRMIVLLAIAGFGRMELPTILPFTNSQLFI